MSSKAWLLFALFLSSFVGCTCASNPEVVPRTPSLDGGVLPVDPGECGALSEQCCPGATCDTGLRCCGQSRCLGVPRGSTCKGNSDCCPGTQCVIPTGAAEGQCLVPQGQPCVGSSDCMDGLNCIENICGGPMVGCGAAGEVCCSQTVDGATVLSCNARLVCNGATCDACGDTNQRCCDGETRCPFAPNLVCILRQTGNPASPTTETCEVPIDCGTVGKQCCGGGCQVGAVCQGGVCQPEEAGCSGEGGTEPQCCGRIDSSGTPQRCCDGDRCDAGFSCVTVSGKKECHTLQAVQAGDLRSPGGDGSCGARKGDRCCLPSLSCDGNLSCEVISLSGVLECSDCQPLGSPCGSITSIFGADQNKGSCCGLAICMPGPYGGRCGAPQGFPCNPLKGDIGCSGQMKCSGVSCQCRTNGESCSNFTDCCGFARCDAGRCQNCKARGTQCTNAIECCPNTNCRPTSPNAADTTNRCCTSVGGDCRRDNECCGGAVCGQNGKCQCLGPGDPRECRSHDDCCSGLFCDFVAGGTHKTCVNPRLGALGAACSKAPECLSGKCQPGASGAGQMYCCQEEGHGCTPGASGDNQCCFGQVCGANGLCTRVPIGSDCFLTGDCQVPSECLTPPGGGQRKCQ